MSTLYVVSPPLEIFEGIRPELRARIVTLPDFLRYPTGRFKRITRSLFAGRIPLPKRILYYWFSKEHFDRLVRAQAGDAILIYEACNVRVLRAIRPYLPKGVPCYIYYCNPGKTTFRRPAEELKAIRALGYRLTSFDPCEAERYGMACTGQYFRYPHPPHPGREAHLSSVPRPTLPHPLRHRHLPAGTDRPDAPPPRSPLLRQEAPDEQPADSLLRLLPPAERLHPRQRLHRPPPYLHRKPHSRSPRTRPRRLRCEPVDSVLLAVIFIIKKQKTLALM